MSTYYKYLKYRHKYFQQAGRCEPFREDDCSVNPSTGRCTQVELGEGDGTCICNYTTERCVLQDKLRGSRVIINKLKKSLAESRSGKQ
jgi:hypothetical protein